MPKNSKKKVEIITQRIRRVIVRPFTSMRSSIRVFLSRRPHRSFRLTRRRDYARSLALPGFFSFTHEVNATLWKYRRIFGRLLIVLVIASAVLAGLGSEEAYTSLIDSLNETTSTVIDGDISQIGNAFLLLSSIVGGGLITSPSDAQQIFGVIIAVLTWLTTVWLLRNVLAGHKVTMRDGLYSAGSPIIAMLVTAFILVIQLIPVGVVILGYTAADSTGLLIAGGIEVMLFWAAALGLVLLSLYWITSTFFALILVTLPGMYPMKALRIAGDIVVGRRLRILNRMLWMALVLSITWLVIMIPLILIDGWLKNLWPVLAGIPVIPFLLVVMGSVSLVWTSSYVYLLYRKVMDDDAQPA